MKKAYHYTTWRLNDDNLFCGVNLGYDFCAEHEMGISGIREAFGIKTYTGNATVNGFKKLFGVLKPTLGIAARIPTIKPETLQFKQKGDFGCMYYASSKLNDTILDDAIKSLAWELNKAGGQNLIGYWGDNSFMLITTNIEYYQRLKKGFLENDIALFTAGKHGLVICIPSLLDARTKSDLESSDFKAWEIRKKAEETGIEEDLIKAKRDYYALKPAWKDKEKTEIWFFLNPVDQTKYNHGWYTVGELKEWIKGKGPIIKL